MWDEGCDRFLHGGEPRRKGYGEIIVHWRRHSPAGREGRAKLQAREPIIAAVWRYTPSSSSSGEGSDPEGSFLGSGLTVTGCVSVWPFTVMRTV